MIHLKIDGLPPSLNNLYVKTRGGGRALSEEGQKYKRETITYLAQQFPQEMRKLKPNVPYLALFVFYFETLENKGWATGKASRYKRTDAGNRVKIIEDCAKDAGGYDDSQNMSLIIVKRQCVPPTPEQSHVFIWDLSVERSPFDDVLDRFCGPQRY
jgi:Holliday junction resolvase RusA-like endonuclease